MKAKRIPNCPNPIPCPPTECLGNCEAQEERELASLQAHRWKLSLEAVSRAQALAWHDLPMNERKQYMAQAEAALRRELAS